MTIPENGFLIFDGAMGTMIQDVLIPGELPEKLNLTNPGAIKAVHKAYIEAGSNVITVNTFGANPLKTPGFAEYIRAGLEIAHEAVEEAGKECLVALDIGPSGRLLAPAGDLDFEDAVSAYAEVIKAGRDNCDLIIIETMTDLLEIKAAVLAAKENCSLPVFASVALQENGRTLSGADPLTVATVLEGLGTDALGVNCSVGPDKLFDAVEIMARHTSVPVIAQPNAGLPCVRDGKTVFDVSADEFAEAMKKMALLGARVLGGCCGTTPGHIRKMCDALKGITPAIIERKEETRITSGTGTVTFGASPLLIGERINPTGKPKFKQALRDGDIDYILGEGISQAEKGVHILDVNVGLPDIDEAGLLREAVTRLQAVTTLPLQLDSSSPAALEGAMRRYNGKALINSVNGKRESMDNVFPLVKKYGGVVVALTLDENGIPDSAEGRCLIAEKIIAEAAKYGIKRSDIIVDTLTMSVSADKNAAKVTLDALKMVKEKCSVHTCLGVSNVSFGLPARQNINAAFFSQALYAGLDAAIMNPYSAEMMSAYVSSNALLGYDGDFEKYIGFSKGLTGQEGPAELKNESCSSLTRSIELGLGGKAASQAEELCSSVSPIDVINGHIIPALDTVGRRFGEGSVFLPQLMRSADAAGQAFGQVKKHITREEGVSKGKVILATVQGDIHDIGKNIVRLLMESYGFEIIDLGRDVPPAAILESARENGVLLVGLSALMTTTVPAMEKTISLIKEKLPSCRVAVGGAVLTEEYAVKIGADFYCADAMETVKAAEKVLGGAE